MKIPTQDEIIEHVRKSLAAKSGATTTDAVAAARRVATALGRYESASQGRTALELARAVGMVVEAPDYHTLANEVWEAVCALPELQGASHDDSHGPVDEIEDVRAEVAAVGAYPLLRARAESGEQILVFGGEPEQRKVQKLDEAIGASCVQWDALRAPSVMAQRVGANVIGVVILHGLLGHNLSEVVTRACRSRGVPYAMVDKPGTAQLHRALAQFEAGSQAPTAVAAGARR